MLEELIKELIVALNANTAAVSRSGGVVAGQPAETPAPKPAGKKSKAAETLTPEVAETPAPAPKNEEEKLKQMTKDSLMALGQTILNFSADRHLTGDESGSVRMKRINEKHGFRGSTAFGDVQKGLPAQTPEKIQAYFNDLKAEIAALEKIAVPSV